MKNEETVANHKMVYLTEQDKAIATKVVATITKIVQADAIFVLGKNMNMAHNMFTSECATEAYTTALWLLILITGDDKRHKAYQDEIEQKCNTTVSCIIMQTCTFARRLNEKDSFALTVLLSAPFIYNTNPNLEKWSKEIAIENVLKTDKKAFLKCFDLVNEYLAGAQLYTIRKYYRLALFMYHQAAELLLTAFIKVKTGLELHIHNISHLSHYVSFLAPGVSECLLGQTEKEQEVFRLLQKSYCSARYDERFEVDFNELEIVRKKVSALMSSLSVRI